MLGPNSQLFITINDSTDISVLVTYLLKDEVKSLLKEFKIPFKSTLKVSELHSLLSEFMITSECTQSMLASFNETLGPLIAINQDILFIFNRLFVAYNLYQTLPDNLLLDSILTNLNEKPRVYPEYKVNRISITWPTRDDLIDYYNYLLIHRNVGVLMESDRLEEALLVIESYNDGWIKAIQESKSNEGHISGIKWLNSFTVGSVMTRMMHRSFKILSTLALNQKRKEGNGSLKKVKFTIKKNKPSYALFTKLTTVLHALLEQREYLQSKRGFWLDTLAKTYHLYIEDIKKTIEISKQALDIHLEPSMSLGFRRSIQKRLDRIMNVTQKDTKWQEITITASKMDPGQRKGKALYFDDESGEHVHVEQLVIKHYERKGWKARHSENSTLSGIFALLFWDILFQDVNGVFASPYQSQPLDYGTECFYESRKSEIERRFVDIQENKHIEIIKIIDERERLRKTFCVGLNWNSFTLEELIEIVECMGENTLTKICRLFLDSYWTRASGFPDLCMWNLKESSLVIVEVKGQGDKLSEKQKEWLEVLLDCGVDAFVVHVAVSD